MGNSIVDMDNRPRSESPWSVRVANRKPRYVPDEPAARPFEVESRVLDLDTACWVRAPFVPAIDAPKGVSAIPINDGSGVWWSVKSNDGQPMWRIEAYDFEGALAEKQRLCAIAGARSGDAFLCSER
jgi:hypothetical protein